MLSSKDITVADANKKNLISTLLFRAGCFPLLSGNEVTQAASWPLAGAGRTVRIETGKWWKNASRWYTLRFCFIFPFPQSGSRFGERRTLFRGRLHQAGFFFLLFAFLSLWPCPSLSLFSVSTFIAFYVLSYLSGTRHKYISARQTAPLNFATCTPRTYSS